LKDQPYELSFNLFTEIGDGALKSNPDRYNDWTRRAIQAIRRSGGNNEKRVIILGAPAKDSDSLSSIAPDIYTGQSYIMSEWHLYASGPNKNDGQKSWVGTGRLIDRENVNKVFQLAADWSKATQVPTWVGAWMPYDNIDATLSQDEVQAFACYFSIVARSLGIPWSMNSLDNFYDRAKKAWVSTQAIGRNSAITLTMQPILNATRCTAMLPAQLAVPHPGPYLVQRWVAARRAAMQAKHAAHAGFIAQVVAREE
jgi:hypothetical protein